MHLPTIVINHHCWLYAYSCAAGLMVYRSPVLTDADKIYKPVAHFLSHHPMREVLRHTVHDPTMMFGRGISIFYKSLAHNEEG